MEKEESKFSRGLEYVAYLVYLGPIGILLGVVLSPLIIVWIVYYYIKVIRPSLKG